MKNIVIYSILIISSYIDYQKQIVYDFACLFLFVIGLSDISLDSFLGLSILPITLLLLNLIKKQEVIGYGDIEFIAALGFILGYQKVVLAFFISNFIALVFSLLIKKERYAYIPFLSIGIVISMNLHLFC